MKKSIIVVLSLIMVLLLVSCGGSSSSVDNNETEEVSVEETNKDMEIITRENHPTYYGSAEEAIAMWKDVKKKVLLPNSTRSYDDSTILVVDAYRNSDLITDVGIYFNNFETNPELTIEDALPIVYTYLPIEIINEYYEYGGSEKIVPNESNANGQTHYVVSYRLKETASEGYYDGDHSYSGSIDVIIVVNNEKVESASIGFGTPRWMMSLEQNGFEREEWEYDFFG